LAQPSVIFEYFAAAGSSTLNPSSIGSTGGSQPHNNFQPYLCDDFIISLFGIFPSQT
jgi:microcystin-dependent protein